MCRRTSLAVRQTVLRTYLQHIGVRNDAPWYRPRYNLPPSQELMIVAQAGAHREVRLMRWGFIPPWTSEASLHRPQINARAETARIKPMFRHAFAYHRGLVIVDGYYQWQRVSVDKIPFRIHRKDGKLFTLAALYEHRGTTDHPLETVAILTTPADRLFRPIHMRMPIVLSGVAQDA